MNILHFKKSVDKTIKNKYNSFKLKVVLDMKYFILFCLFFTAFSQATPDIPWVPDLSTPLHYWAMGSSAIEIGNVKSLIEAGEDVNARAVLNRTPLHYANNSKEIVQILIDAGADVNARDTNQETPLHFAKTTGVAQTLIDAGADVNARNYDSTTPLYYADNRGVTQTLINAGAGNVFSRFFYRVILNCQAAFQ